MDKKDRIDLYSTIQALRESDEKQPITRLLYVVQLTDERGVRTDMVKFFQQWIDQNQTNNNKITGYMMVREIYILHMIESSNEIVNKYINYLHSEFNKEKQKFVTINIVAFTDDNLDRCYKEFISEIVYQGGQSVSECDRADSQITEKNWQIYSQFCDAGKKLNQNRNFKPAQEIQINNEDLCMLMLKRYMSVNEYHQVYLADMEIDFEQEQLYPYPPNITNILEFSENGKFSQYVEQ